MLRTQVYFCTVCNVHCTLYPAAIYISITATAYKSNYLTSLRNTDINMPKARELIILDQVAAVQYIYLMCLITQKIYI